jgi:sugar phosphate isomerase/epimerase
MMTFGTIGAFGFDDFRPAEIIGLYAQAGCRLVQAYRNRERNITAGEILSVCGDLSVRVDSLHAHFGDDLDPSSEDEPPRRAAMELYRSEAEFCRQLGATVAVVHPSPRNAAAGNLERRYAQFRASLQDLARIGEQTGVVFAVENMPAYHPVGGDVRRLVEEIAAVNDPHVIFLLDFGHAHMTCGIADALKWAGPNLKYTHVHDNDGVNDTHMLPYRGTLPWDVARQGLHRIGYDGVFLLEVFEMADDLRRLLNPEWLGRMQAILMNGR